VFYSCSPLAIYFVFCVKDNPISSNAVTVVRVSALAPADGSYEGVLDICKDFMGDTFPYMFEFQQGEDIIAVQLAKSGIGEWLIIGALVSVPIGIIVYPRIKK